MTVSQPDNEAIFHAARDIPDPNRRREHVRQACGGDDLRIAHIEALLAAAASPDSLLDHPAIGPAADATQEITPDGGESLEFLAPSDKPDVLGRLGHYEILEVIGRGGMGIVLRAFDAQLHRVVAVKVMAAQLATNAAARRRFAREAQAQAAVSHDHVVTIHAVEGDCPQPFLIMHYVAGLSLQQRLDRDGPLELHEILRIGMQTASGLAAAHAQGLIHRDIKPANILLENGVERVKITDFGLARAADDASLTQSGAVAGTPHFMAPEQARGEALDARTDLFSLGSVLYAMCTGRSPFRASGSMAVLKRVCEETPTPIRETNPAIPDWLACIIDKLHAKDPAERFQSAAEVADLLSRHLAHVQHPSINQLPSPLREERLRVRGQPQVRPRHRYALAAAVLLFCLLGSLSLTEATGVTHLASTVIRILTPDGTLIVQSNDPAVKVTIEGDGGLVINGAGPQEVRLRPGSYRVHANKDGQPVPLERELVSIATGGRETIRVKLEAPAELAIPKSETGAFLLLATGKERKFDTLAEAVQHASDGDTIEVRGNGPFVSDGVATGIRLVIRAGEGCTPAITLSQAAANKAIPLLSTTSSLVLEGLELRRSVEGDGYKALLGTGGGGALHVANCRLICKADQPSLSPGTLLASNEARSVSLRNSALICNATGAAGWRCNPAGRWNIENCVLATEGIGFGLSEKGFEDVTIGVRGNSFVGRCMNLTLWSKSKLPETDGTPPIRLDFSHNVVLSTRRDAGMLYFHQYQRMPPFSTAEAEAHLPRLLHFDERQNVYQDDMHMLGLATDWKLHEGTRGQTLADWNEFWNHGNTGSVSGAIRFQGGDLVARAKAAPEELTAEDFRLRPDSAGYRAGPDGKDLGADVDLVGPGPAYERWKKTPEYQQWLMETGQQE